MVPMARQRSVIYLFANPLIFLGRSMFAEISDHLGQIVYEFQTEREQSTNVKLTCSDGLKGTEQNLDPSETEFIISRES